MNYSLFKFSKPKNVKKKRISVEDKIYNKVYERDEGICRICGSGRNLHLHHIIYRSEDKSKINDINNCIMLCNECHLMIHENKKKWQPILLKLVGGTKDE